MLRNKLLLVFLCACLTAGAQEKNRVDTIPARDSALLDELKQNIQDNIPTISIDDADMGDGGGQNISSVLAAGRDPFFSAASFNFSALRFRIRGYDNDFFG
ncbi:MAG: TonB-dependent receptor, partial [Flavisolibacter sp.]|nr:TonB-dependent receptor [Flavisolibacter sp.]